MSHAPGVQSAGPLWRTRLGSAEALLGSAVAVVASAILVFEVTLLFAGVVARYVFHNPLIWADELASTLFVWLSSLGAVLATRRNAHMRLTASSAAPVRSFAKKSK